MIHKTALYIRFLAAFLAFLTSTGATIHPKTVLACETFGPPQCVEWTYNELQIKNECIRYTTPCYDGERPPGQDWPQTECNEGFYACSRIDGDTACCPIGPSGGGGVDIPCSSRLPEYYGEKGTVFIAANGFMGANLTWGCRGSKTGRDVSCGREFGHLHLWFSQSVNGADCTKVTEPTAWCPLGKQPIFINKYSKSYTVDPTKGAYPLLLGKRYYFAITYHMDECHPDGSASFLTSCSIQTGQKNITAVLNKDTPYLYPGVSNIGTWKIRYYTSDRYTVSVTKPVPTATPKPGKTPVPGVNYIDVSTYPYGVTLYPIKTTGVTPVTITQNVIAGTSKTQIAKPLCSDTSLVTVIDSVTYDPWWQVKDSDVMSGSDIKSLVPVGKYFSLAGAGGFPGVTAYNGTTNLASTNSSAKGWLVNGASTNDKTYSYDSFYNQVPSEITVNPIMSTDSVLGKLTSSSSPDANEYSWYKYDGAVNNSQPLTIPATDLTSKKVILFVDNADVNITGNINLTDGVGFFMLITNGNVSVDSAVGGTGPNLEGLYFTDGKFSDGTGSTQLHVRGSVVSNFGSGFDFGRDLVGAANVNPSELFEYAPDQIMLFPKVLGSKKMSWQEVAPDLVVS